MSVKLCEVKDCSNESFKTVPGDLAKKALELSEEKTKIHLCKEHYKEYKKGTKIDRELKKMDW